MSLGIRGPLGDIATFNRACVHRLITGGERRSGKQQGPHNETLFMYRVHCRQRTRGKE
ncbi:hypothetical protein GP946_26245 [Escherichia coli]|nr:hypothetical protein [Escherichia coli]